MKRRRRRISEDRPVVPGEPERPRRRGGEQPRLFRPPSPVVCQWAHQRCRSRGAPERELGKHGDASVSSPTASTSPPITALLVDT